MISTYQILLKWKEESNELTCDKIDEGIGDGFLSSKSVDELAIAGVFDAWSFPIVPSPITSAIFYETLNI